MATTVATVLGDVPVEDLGRTLVHEHVLCDVGVYWNPESDPAIAAEPLAPKILGDVRSAPFAPYDNLALRSIGDARDALELFAAAGGGTIVDVTSHGLHRQPRALAWLAEQTGVNLVAGCGYYIAGSYSPDLSNRTAGHLAEEMIRELTDGIGGTGIRAGVIGEIGVGQWPEHPQETIVLEAASTAQRETGRAVVLHCPPATSSVVPLAERLLDLGFDPALTVLGHLDVRLRDDLDAFSTLAGLGFGLGLDTFGREVFYPERRAQHTSDARRIEIVAELVERGHEDRLFLSQDICFRHELAAHGGVGYHHVLARIVPRLLDQGVSAETCDRLLTVNPARLLAGRAREDDGR